MAQQQFLSLPLTVSKKTAGTIVYGNEDKGFKGIYVPKALLPTPVPETITMVLLCEGGKIVAQGTGEEDGLEG